MSSILAAPWVPSVFNGICQPCQERASTPIACNAMASSPDVTCSPEATMASYSRASWNGETSCPIARPATPGISRTKPTSSLVRPAMADTTTATSWPASCSRLTCRATLAMRSRSATEVPPNFMTRRGIGRGSERSDAPP